MDLLLRYYKHTNKRIRSHRALRIQSENWSWTIRTKVHHVYLAPKTKAMPLWLQNKSLFIKDTHFFHLKSSSGIFKNCPEHFQLKKSKSILFTFLHGDTLKFGHHLWVTFHPSVAVKHVLCCSRPCLSECRSLRNLAKSFFLKVSFWTIMKHKVKLIRELLFYITPRLNPSKKVILAVSKYQYWELGTECECCCWPWFPEAPACWACCWGLCALCGKNILSPSQVLLLVSTQ